MRKLSHVVMASLVLRELESDEVEVNGAKVKRGEALRFINAEIARVEANRNEDEFDGDNIDELVSTLALKPISVEHESGSMAGIFTAARRDGAKAMVDGLVYLKHADGAVVDDLAKGKMSLSIEAGAEQALCSLCGQSFDLAGDYCEHIRTKASRRQHKARRRFKQMFATGGALTRQPAGRLAAINPQGITLVASMDENDEDRQQLLEDEPPKDEEKPTEAKGKDYSPERRKELASKGEAMDDGSYPIADEEDLKNAIQAVGRAKSYGAAKAHIIKRAKAMGKTSLLPDEWVKAVDLEAQVAGLTGDLQAKTSEASQLAAENGTLKAEVERLAAENAQLKGQTGDLQKLARELRLHAELVGAGHLTEDEWTTDKDVVLGMDEKALALLKRPRRSRITLAPPASSVTVLSDAEPKSKPVIVMG